MKKQLSLSLFTILVLFPFVVLLLPLVYADGLAFNDIDGEVDGETAADVDVNGGSIEAGPGDSVELTVEAQNTFSFNTQNHKIKHIDISLDVENFCSHDLDENIEETNRIEDLDPDIDDSTTFRFTIPTCAEEGNYDADIKIEGEDEDGTEYLVKQTVFITIQKEPSELTLYFSVPEPQILDCAERTFSVSVEAHNIGEMDEDAGLLVINDDIGINRFDFMDLRTGKWTDEDTFFVNTYTFTLADSIPAGEYDLRVEVEFDSNRQEIKRYQTIIVPDCSAEAVNQAGAIEEGTTETGVQTTSASAQTEQEETETTDSSGASSTDSEANTPEEKEETEDLFSVRFLLEALGVAVVILFGMIVLLKRKAD